MVAHRFAKAHPLKERQSHLRGYALRRAGEVYSHANPCCAVLLGGRVQAMQVSVADRYVPRTGCSAQSMSALWLRSVAVREKGLHRVYVDQLRTRADRCVGYLHRPHEWTTRGAHHEID